MTEPPPPWSNVPPGGYPPPPGGYPPAAALGSDHTNLFGWLGIVLGFLCCFLVGVILGVLSIRDAKKFGNSPLLGYVAIGVSALNLIAGAIYAANR